jgi:hypothetical protein
MSWELIRGKVKDVKITDNLSIIHAMFAIVAWTIIICDKKPKNSS